ncbi:hypothetical protein C9374_014270 [Naegleria lovaniensis]|uniref:Uncharacterized protein n=1 Tax=Naegleria lovaniensis TaxID=51637 RepID=A0AA88GEA5_NAELO|nr:uncharacterized protein C9374_014270 [Naegleria lovaniensis]KAG2370747.1 hypothetical protein C9374_014270 [Naegleria lovaniensis]
MILSLSLFSLHIVSSYYKYYSYVVQYCDVMRKNQHSYVMDETIFTLLSPYIAMLLLESVIFSLVFQVSMLLAFLMSVTMVVILFQFRPPALVTTVGSNNVSSFATTTSFYSFISNVIIHTLYFVTFIVNASSHFSFLSITLLSLPLILIISHTLIKLCSFYVFYANTEILENHDSKYLIPIWQLANPELKLLAKQLFYMREEMALIQTVGLYMIMLLSWILSMATSKNGIWCVIGMTIGIQCLTQIRFIVNRISLILTPLFEKHLLSQFAILAFIFPYSNSDLESQELELIQQVEKLKISNHPTPQKAIVTSSTSMNSQPQTSPVKEVKPVSILKKPSSSTTNDKEQSMSNTLDSSEKKSSKVSVTSETSQQEKQEIIHPTTSSTTTTQRVPSMRFRTSSLAKMLKQGQAESSTNSSSTSGQTDVSKTTTNVNTEESTIISPHGGVSSGVAIVGMIGERLKQKLQLRTLKDSNSSIVSDSTSSVEKSENGDETHSQGTMVVKKAKIAKPRREKTRTNISSLLNHVIEATTDQHDIELPNQNEFDKLEEISKLEKKLGAIGALSIQKSQPHKKDEITETSTTTEENTSASSVISSIGNRMAKSSSSSLIQEEETNKNNTSTKPKGGVAIGGGGISLNAILMARNKLNKTGEDLK